MRKQLAELRKYGYLVRERVRGEDGKLATQSVLYDVPQVPLSEEDRPEPSRQGVASRSDQGRFASDGRAPATPPWRDGVTSKDTEEPQVPPSRHTSASRPDQEEQRIPAGGTDSPPPGAQSEDQEKNKKISQSPRADAAVRWLRAEYGLTEEEALVAWEIAESWAPTRIHIPARYLARMKENGQLGDIVDAIRDYGAEAARRDLVRHRGGSTPTPTPPKFERRMLFEAVKGQGDADAGSPVQQPLLVSVSDPASRDEEGLPAAEERRALRARLAEIRRRHDPRTGVP